MYGYIYLTTNLVNNKKYIGKRTEDFLNDSKYLGSGTIIKKAINKYSFDNFSKTLLEECNSEDELNEREVYWIAKYNAVEDPMFYNLTPGANGSARGSKRSRDTKNKLSNSMTGKVIPEEIRRKIADKISSQIWVTNGVIETKATEDNLREFIEKGFRRGRLEFSDLHKEKMRNLRRPKLSEEECKRISERMSGDGNPFYGRKHSDNSKLLISKRQSGRIYVKKDGKCRRIFPDELETYLNDGWTRGMIRIRK